MAAFVCDRIRRKMIGATSPLASNSGTIRGDFALITGKNIMYVPSTPPNMYSTLADIYTVLLVAYLTHHFIFACDCSLPTTTATEATRRRPLRPRSVCGLGRGRWSTGKRPTSRSGSTSRGLDRSRYGLFLSLYSTLSFFKKRLTSPMDIGRY